MQIFANEKNIKYTVILLIIINFFYKRIVLSLTHKISFSKIFIIISNIHTEYFDSKVHEELRKRFHCFVLKVSYILHEKSDRDGIRHKIDFYVIMFVIEQKQSRAGWNQIYMSRYVVADSFLDGLYDSHPSNIGEKVLIVIVMVRALKVIIIPLIILFTKRTSIIRS